MTTHQLDIANGRMHAGTALATDASINNRLLIAYSLGGATQMSTVRTVACQAVTPWQAGRAQGRLGRLLSSDLRPQRLFSGARRGHR